jgi:hypothetical protein
MGSKTLRVPAWLSTGQSGALSGSISGVWWIWTAVARMEPILLLFVGSSGLQFYWPSFCKGFTKPLWPLEIDTESAPPP